MTAPKLLGRYELLHELGRGGMAELYLARRRGAAGFEKLVAIKRILPHLAREPQFVELFQQEARIASKLSHPNICPVDELDEEGGELYLVMEYLEGVSWAELSAAVPASESLALTASVLAQACEGLHHAHALDVVHRDVSPQNLFVTTNGVCKVLDFGVAKLLGEGNARTRTGVLKGKLPYMSPEQIEGEPIDQRSDVWALGVVLWEAIAKRMLFERTTDFQIWKAITEAEIPLLGIPAIDDVIRQALARDRTQRFATTRALGEAIRQIATPLTSPEIAEILRTHCGVKLAERSTAVSSAIATAPTEVSGSVVLRDAPVVIARNSAAATVDAIPKRRPRWPWLAIAAVVAAVAVILMRHRDEPVRVPAPPAPVAVVIPDAAVIPIDAAPVVVVTPPQQHHNNHHAITHPVVVETGTGTVTIDSSPYATIYIDDKKLGVTPLFKQSLAAGTHALRAVTQDGSKTIQITVSVDRDLNLGTLSWQR